MAEEVKVVVARRQQVPTQNFEYFAKAQEAVDNELTWLESQHANFNSKTPTYREFNLVCCWDHLVYYDFVPNMLDGKYQRLHGIVNRVSESNSIVYQTSHSFSWWST